MKKFFYIAPVLLLLAFSCKKEDCTTLLPPPNYFTFTIVDEAGNNILETKDSIRMYNSITDQYITHIPYGDKSQFQIFYDDIESGKDIYLEISVSDTDTLSVDFSEKKEDCFTSYEALKIIYNRNVMLDLDSPFELKKY